MRHIGLMLLFATCASTLSIAQGDEGLPLRIENLLAPSGGSEISYSIRHTAYGSETADRFDLEFGYGYGLTEDIEIGLSLSGSYIDDRNADPFRDWFSAGRLRDEKETITRIGELRAEISRSLSPENETPGVFGWVGIDLLENRAAEGVDIEPMSGAFNAGLSVYRTYDPIVLRVAFGYVHRPEEPTASGLWDAGDAFSISPTVSFAVNSIVSISATSTIQVTLSNTLDGQDNYSYRRTTVTAGLGVSLSLRDRTTVYISGSTFASAGGGASFGAFVRYRLKRSDLLAELEGEIQSTEKGSAIETEKSTGGWWVRHRAKVGGIAAGLIVGASVRNLTR